MTTRIPSAFAASGDKVAIPDTDANGFVSWLSGYGPDYARVIGTDPDAKPIERGAMNYLFGAITENLKQWQDQAIPEWRGTAAGTSGITYVKNALAMYSGDVYRATRAVPVNVSPTDTSYWEWVPTLSYLRKVSPMPAGGGDPTSEVLASGTDFSTLLNGTWEVPDSVASASANSPTASGGILESKMWIDAEAPQRVLQRYTTRTGIVYIRARVNNAWGIWQGQYGTANVPNAGKVGAVSITGDSMTGRLNITANPGASTFDVAPLVIKSPGDFTGIGFSAIGTSTISGQIRFETSKFKFRSADNGAYLGIEAQSPAVGANDNSVTTSAWVRNEFYPRTGGRVKGVVNVQTVDGGAAMSYTDSGVWAKAPGDTDGGWVLYVSRDAQGAINNAESALESLNFSKTNSVVEANVLRARGDVTAGNSIAATNDLRAGNNAWVEKDLHVTQVITAGGDISSSANVNATNFFAKGTVLQLGSTELTNKNRIRLFQGSDGPFGISAQWGDVGDDIPMYWERDAVGKPRALTFSDLADGCHVNSAAYFAKNVVITQGLNVNGQLDVNQSATANCGNGQNADFVARNHDQGWAIKMRQGSGGDFGLLTGWAGGEEWALRFDRQPNSRTGQAHFTTGVTVPALATDAASTEVTNAAWVRKMINNCFVGKVCWESGTTDLGAGWVIAAGQVYPIAGHELLYARVGDIWNDGTVGAGSFKLPDLRGVYLRGSNWNGAGKNPAGDLHGFSGYQADAMQIHRHEYLTSINKTSTAPGGDPTVFGVWGSGTTIIETGSQSNARVDFNETRVKSYSGYWCIFTGI